MSDFDYRNLNDDFDKLLNIDPECIDCKFRDADCIIHKDRHVCMPEKRIGYKVVGGVLEAIEFTEGFK